MIYLLIFIFKILENTLSTLRIVVLGIGKKITGAVLLFLVCIVWILSNGLTIANINIYSILSFSFGSLIGSYIGSLLEDVLALGDVLIISICNNDISSSLRNKGYIVTSLNGEGKNGYKNILLIVIKRKKLKLLRKDIYIFDNNAIILNGSIRI